MANDRVGAWALAAAVITYGCTNTSGGGGPNQTGSGFGALGGSGGGGKGTATGNTPGGGSGPVTGGPGPGTSVPSGGREPVTVSIEKAVLTTTHFCEVTAGASACTVCIQKTCCQRVQQCTENNFCVSYAGCLADCRDDKNCWDGCVDRFLGTGTDAYQDLMNCAIDSSCNSQCGGD